MIRLSGMMWVRLRRTDLIESIPVMMNQTTPSSREVILQSQGQFNQLVCRFRADLDNTARLAFS